MKRQSLTYNRISKHFPFLFSAFLVPSICLCTLEPSHPTSSHQYLLIISLSHFPFNQKLSPPPPYLFASLVMPLPLQQTLPLPLFSLAPSLSFFLELTFIAEISFPILYQVFLSPLLPPLRYREAPNNHRLTPGLTLSPQFAHSWALINQQYTRRGFMIHDICK